MATYTFQDLLNNPAIGDSFDPESDTLALNGAATEITVVTAATYTEFQRVIAGQTYSVRIAVTADQLDANRIGSALLVSSGRIAFGDNTTMRDYDPLGNFFSSDNVAGSQFHGLGGVDTFNGGAAADLVFGNQNEDILLGGGGADTLYGGIDNDWVDGYSLRRLTVEGSTYVPPPAESLLIYGNQGADTLYGYYEDDRLFGGQGEDLILAFGGDDLIHGNNDADRIHTGSGQDTVLGGGGDDTIFGTADREPVINPGANLIYGNQGNDKIHGGQGADRIFGGQGDDTILVFSQGRYGQVIHGNNDNDLILGQAGTAADSLFGDDGNDTLHGGHQGGDLVSGGAGDDELHGGNLASHFSGELGNDVLYGGAGGDTLRGGSGNDTIYGGQIAYTDTVNGGPGEFIHGGPGDDAIYLGGDAFFAVKQTVFGGQGNDSIVGNQGSNLLVGGTGSDTIVAGWNGADTMDGSNDTHVDYFVWRSMAALNMSAEAAAASQDQVDNFVKGRDKLVFDATGLLADGKVPGDVMVVTGVAGATGKLMLAIGTIRTATGGPLDGALIGSFANKSALNAALATRYISASGNMTGATYYAFAANTRHTRLWVLSLKQNDGAVTLDAGHVLGTIHVMAGLADGDIVVM